MTPRLCTRLAFIVTCAAALFSTSAASAQVVSKHGLLQAKGNRIVGHHHGKPVSFAGMSLFWSQWIGQYYTEETVAWLKEDWNATIVRASLGIARDGYLQDPEPELAKIRTVVDAAIKHDLYVVIDWHDHHAENHTAEAVAFFTKMAQEYGDQPNVIYEIYNEPLRVSWSEVVKPYAEEVIAAIRKYDSDNLIVVGTPFWSQRVDDAAADPIEDPNLAYVLHFYAGTHKAELRARAEKALASGVALMVTEWGTVNANGDGGVDSESVDEWMEFLREHQLTHLNWSVSNKAEGAAILKPAVETLSGWTADDLTASGRRVRDIIRNWSN